MSSNGNQKTIFLTSNDKGFLALLKHHFPFHRIKYSADHHRNMNPDYIVSICRDKCDAEECLKKAHFSLIHPQATYVICRPVLKDYASQSKYGYWLSYMNESFGEKLASYLFYPSVPCLHRNVDVIEAKKQIIEVNGSIKGIAALNLTNNKSVYSISKKLKGITGFNLKGFHKRITLCHSLHDLYLSNIPIKEIAYKYCMHPNAFRSSFKAYFGISPVKIRIIRDLF